MINNTKFAQMKNSRYRLILLLPSLILLQPSLPQQLPSTQFSLEHPVQYFIESRKVRGGPIDTHVKQEDDQHPPPPPPSSSADMPSHSAGPPPPAESGDQATNGMEFGDVSELDLEGGFDDNDDNMDCN